MSRVITFSRQFPAYHPKAGINTEFVPKILNSIHGYRADSSLFKELNPGKEKELGLFLPTIPMHYYTMGAKYHTIRAGHRWKAGDKFSPRVWSGRPYNSPQIIIAPDMEVKKVWDFEIDDCGVIAIGGKYYFDELDEFGFVSYERLASNDGLTERDFLNWFKYPAPFDGQIICWDENVNY